MLRFRGGGYKINGGKDQGHLEFRVLVWFGHLDMRDGGTRLETFGSGTSVCRIVGYSA